MRHGTIRSVVAAAVLVLVPVASAYCQATSATRYRLELSTETHGFPSETAMYTQLMAQLAAMPKGPGMPDMSSMMGDMAALGAPTHRIKGEAAYPGKAPEAIWVTVPSDLKLERDRLPLTVPKPVALPADVVANMGAGGTNAPPMHFEQKLYWNPAVAKGPVIKSYDVDPSKLPRGVSARQLQGMALGEERETDGGQVATGENDKLPPAVVGRGTYILNTGGEIPLEGFLSPITVTAPQNAADVVPEKGFELKWNPVQGARGFILFVSQFLNVPGESRAVYWVSTTVQPPERLIWNHYEQATTIADDLRDGILMPGEATSCVVPPGVFVAGTPLMISLWAIGNDYWDHTGQLLRQGTLRALWNGNTFAAAAGMGPGIAKPRGRGGATGLPPGVQMPADGEE